MPKGTLKRSSATGTQDSGSALDLNALIVEINLERLVLDLEVACDEDGSQPCVPEPPPSDTAAAAVERRLAVRFSKSELGDDVQVSLPRATSTLVVNVSDTGVLIETNCQLHPGRTTDVFVKLRGERQTFRATVVRSSLHVLPSNACVYRSALHFERIIGLARRLAR